MNNGIPNQKYRANKMLDSIVSDFSGINAKAILVVTYMLDKDLTFARIRKAIEDAGIDYKYTGDFNLSSNDDTLSCWITLVDVSDHMEYRGSFTDAYIFCEKEHIEEEVNRRVTYCTDVRCIFDKEI